MRVLVLNILVLLSTVLYGQIYSAANSSLGRTGGYRSDMYSGMSVSGRNNIVTYSNSNIGYTSRTGYTTSIGYTTSTGRSVYGGNSPFKGYSTYRGIYTNPVATGRGMNYNPNMQYGGSSSNNNGPRRVHGYTADGEYVGDDNGDEDDFWEDGYEYYWDDVDKCWYRYSASDGWRKYNHTLGFLLGWHWALTSWGGRQPPSNPVKPTYEENPVPLSDTPWLIMFLLGVGYIAFVSFRRRKTQKS